MPFTKLQQTIDRAISRLGSTDVGGTSLKSIVSPKVTNSQDARVLAFPQKLRDESKARPFIMFRCDEGVSICLPCPPALEFANKASYTPVDLGAVIGTAQRILESGDLGDLDETKLMTQLKAGGFALGTTIAAASSVPTWLGGEKASALGKIISRRTLNPSTNTFFQNVDLRTFRFTFKLMPKTAEDAKIISEIGKTFQKLLYPTAEPLYGTVLSFPPDWSIKFFDGAAESTFIPKIDKVSLTGVDVTYNPEGNIFHVDGSPVGTNFTLAFTEKRALTRSKIEELQA
jgi:hypothetical protein